MTDILRLAEQVDSFYANIKTRTIPTYVINPEQGQSASDSLGLLESLSMEIQRRTPTRQNSRFAYGSQYSCQIVADSQVVSENPFLTEPSYKLKVDVVARREGGHHC